jgi:uncharacterized protein YbgA (DUF1722 family)/uncharacterized protein YbbK (DUF523 family)
LKKRTSTSRANTGSGYDWTDQKAKVGISTCLLGEPVRYDGAHKRDRYLTDTLGSFFEWVPVCPEVECGLPVPRESMHLEGDPESPRLVTSRTHVDLTEQMLRWSRKRLKELEGENLCGFIFKSNSPSSGMQRVRIYDKKGMPQKIGVGVFAMQFMRHFTLLPVEDEGRLHDPRIRENFIERVFCLLRYRTFRDSDGTVGGLVKFHTDHKIQILSHSQKLHRTMGNLVAHTKEYQRAELLSQYEALLMEVLRVTATTRSNANALMHIMGYLKTFLTSDEKQELLELIDEYKGELIPLIVPITMVRHYARKYDEPYLNRQTYLNPHPIELKLRNHA